MYARSISISAKVALIDDGIAFVRDEVMPALQQIEGFSGLSLIVNRETAHCITTSAWRSEDAMHASDGQLWPFRERAEQTFGTLTGLDEWEIAVLHRDHRAHRGSGVRVTWMQVPPAGLERAVDVYRMATVPSAENLEGFCSASLLVERSSGLVVSSVTYDSMQAMERNRAQAHLVRMANARDVGAELLEVGEYELALAHLRVPEMA